MDLWVSPLPPGSRISLVAYINEFKDGTCFCTGLSPQQSFVVTGAAAHAPGLYSFYDLERAQEDSACHVVDGVTEIHVHHEKDHFTHVTVLDFCSGMGGFSIGSQLLGMRTAIFVEKSALACEALRANFASPVIEGDIGDVDTLKKIHPLIGAGYLQATGGFPCQGFSLQGDQQGMNDHRSHSLYAILRASWLLQVDDILLECVANVIHFPLAQQSIDDFAQLTDMHIFKLIFDLQDQWPVRRNRFWCRMMRKTVPKVEIPRWPTTQCYRKLGDIMPLDAIWDELIEHQLEWDPSELAIYLDPCYGADQRVLLDHDKAPTVLHSWGHVNRPCPCGCRAAFSVARLRSGGARGFGLISSQTGRHRHLHPEEGAMLCTVPPTFHFPMPPRSALSLLGQIAAPLQVVWVQAHVLAGLQMHFWGWTGIDPQQILTVLQQELASHAFHRWITPQHYEPRLVSLQIEGENTIYKIRINCPTTVQDLIQAERKLAGWGQYAIVTHQGQRLHPNTQLQPGVLYHIRICTSKQVRTFPDDIQLLGGGPGDISRQLGDRLIWTGMQELIQVASMQKLAPTPFVFYPFRVNQLLQQTPPPAVQASWKARRQHETGDILFICEWQDHWLLVHGLWNQQEQGLDWILHDGLYMHQALPCITQVVHQISQALGDPCLGLQLGHSHPQRHGHTCGTIALLHFAHCLRLLDLDFEVDIALLHDWLLKAQTMPCQIYAGGPEDLQRQLADILQSKGVPKEVVSDRVQLVMQRIGQRQIQQILKAKNPWADLKAAASKPGTMFRLITVEEQKDYVAARAQTKHGAKIKNHKTKKPHKGPGHDAPVLLDPSQFELNPHHFKDDSDLPVHQITFAEVEAEARGVALCNVDMARQFLNNNAFISTDALALIFLDSPEAETIDKVGMEPIIIPAKFKGTDEQTLIYGHILQLGDSKVTRESASKNLAQMSSRPR
jgi:hypothetical protein